MLPLGVLIPTRNSMAYLPDHVRALNAWLHLAQEVVVVDSHSTDGTVEYLREHLRHPSVQFLRHPPGLYESWNFGIRRLHTKYAYFATVGDCMLNGGIRHLVSVAEDFECDVVVSPPQLMDTQSNLVSELRWPIHQLLPLLKLNSPPLLTRYETFFYATIFALGHGLSSILGSSASNLYRTAVLKCLPFPTDCGPPGDTVWGVENALNIKLALTPMACSMFLFHPKEEDPDAVQALKQRVTQRLFHSAEELLRREFGIAQGRALLSGGARMVEILDELRQFEHYRNLLRAYRRNPIPWYLDARAWDARIKREKHRKRFEELSPVEPSEAWVQFLQTSDAGQLAWPAL